MVDVIEWEQDEQRTARPRRVRRGAWVAAALAATLAVPLIAGRTAAEADLAAQARVACTGATYTVRSGDGWYPIAYRTKVKVSDLLAANGASLSTPLYPGQVICLDGRPTTSTSSTTTTTTAPKPGTCSNLKYTVVRGDGWYLIASKNKVLVSALLSANGATLTTPLYPGRVLCLPASASAPGSPNASVPPTTAAPANTAPKPAQCDGTGYTVVRGDGWYLIAYRAKIKVADLLAANGATLTTMLHPGRVLCLPGVGDSASNGPGSTTTTTPPKAGPNSIVQFPVQGLCWYTDTFGAPRAGGRRHEGVDIIAKAGLNVYAAVDGTLTKQYIDAPGLLAGNGWRLTAPDGTYYFYGHFSGFAPGLKVGSKVKAGQIIGYLGMTRSAATPHLHFEVHPGGGAAVNPTPIVKAVDGCKVTTVPPQPAAG